MPMSFPHAARKCEVILVCRKIEAAMFGFECARVVAPMEVPLEG
jgi:hypothetical protein